MYLDQETHPSKGEKWVTEIIMQHSLKITEVMLTLFTLNHLHCFRDFECVLDGLITDDDDDIYFRRMYSIFK